MPQGHRLTGEEAWSIQSVLLVVPLEEARVVLGTDGRRGVTAFARAVGARDDCLLGVEEKSLWRGRRDRVPVRVLLNGRGGGWLMIHQEGGRGQSLLVCFGYGGLGVGLAHGVEGPFAARTDRGELIFYAGLALHFKFEFKY